MLEGYDASCIIEAHDELRFLRESLRDIKARGNPNDFENAKSLRCREVQLVKLLAVNWDKHRPRSFVFDPNEGCEIVDMNGLILLTLVPGFLHPAYLVC